MMSLTSAKCRYNVMNAFSESMQFEPFELSSNKFIVGTNNYSSIINISSPTVLTLPEPDLNIVSSEEESFVAEQERPRKKRRSSNNSSSEFRPYQAEKWQERFDELIVFRKEKGHCLVPHTYPSNAALARWVKRQRYQYKLLQVVGKSSMTQDRLDILEEIGFAWDSHEAAWQERLSELLDFKAGNGNCLVPSNYPAQPQLATWVKCQRRQYKLYWEGRPSNITVYRIMILEKHSFEWLSSYSKKAAGKEAKALNALLPLEADGENGLVVDLMSDLSED
jgi:hypothetical protein